MAISESPNTSIQPAKGMTRSASNKDLQAKVDGMLAEQPSTAGMKRVPSVGKGLYAGVAGLVMAEGEESPARLPSPGMKRTPSFGKLSAAATVSADGKSPLPRTPSYSKLGQAAQPVSVEVLLEKDEGEEAADEAEVFEDAETRQLNEATYSLSRQVVAEAAKPSAKEVAEYRGTGEPKETQFYELLGMKETASTEEIKKAFFKITKFHTNSDLHPGEHCGDQAAHQHFVEQSVAYQILSDPAKREKYDKEGKASVDFSLMDPRAFVTMAYGSEAFEPLVGTLTLAYTESHDPDPVALETWQAARERILAEYLERRLRLWLEGKEAQFVEENYKWAQKLKHEPFGLPMLHCIGYTYYHKAEVLLGMESFLGLPSYLSHKSEYNHHFKKTAHDAKAAAARIDEVTHGAQAGIVHPANGHEQFVNDVWLVNALDIESTLRHVVEMVVLDSNLSKADKKRRAQGIMRLGKVFMQPM